MKQFITSEQWEELNEEEYKKFRPLINILEVRTDKPFYEYITIGKLIEFLGEDLDDIGLAYGDAIVKLKTKTFPDPDLVDALWEAVKFKLKS